MVCIHHLFTPQDEVLDSSQADQELDPNDPKAIIAKAAVVDDEYGKGKASEQTYYTIAHTLLEPVTEQPDMLSFGNLKEYQVIRM